MSGSPAPKKLESMPTRRAPLASIPNAVNSPYRPAPSAAFKRSRFELDAKEDLKYNQQPPAKRLAVDNGQTRYRTPPRKQTTQYSEDRVFAKRPTASQPNAFERKLLAAKERQTNYDTERQEKTAAASLNGIRQWQKHYRRVFPYFVFYFESIPDDVRVKYSKFVRVLGAVSVLALAFDYLRCMMADNGCFLERREVFFQRCHSCYYNPSCSCRKRVHQSNG